LSSSAACCVGDNVKPGDCPADGVEVSVAAGLVAAGGELVAGSDGVAEAVVAADAEVLGDSPAVSLSVPPQPANNIHGENRKQKLAHH